MDAQFDKGLVTRKQLMGEEFVANALGNATSSRERVKAFLDGRAAKVSKDSPADSTDI